jgi:hypothetical protein
MEIVLASVMLINLVKLNSYNFCLNLTTQKPSAKSVKVKEKRDRKSRQL